MKLSVVIPCFNAAATLTAQLDALCAQDWVGPWETIVADNGSRDDSRAVAADFIGRLPNLRVVEAAQRRGAAHARNMGARLAGGDALAFCDADDQVDVHWLSAIAEGLKRYAFIASRLDFAKLNECELGHGQSKGLQRIAYPPFWQHAGASGLAVQRVVHEQVGGFDEALPYLEDTDYCFRIQRAGHELHFFAGALVHVRQPARPALLFNQARRWAQYNVLMNRRYGGGATIDRPWRVHLQGWCDLVGCLPRIRDPAQRPAWLKSLGTQVGLLEGALRYHVPPVR